MMVDLELGARPLTEGGVRFRVWAPRVKTLSVATTRGLEAELQRGEDGVFEGILAGAAAGDDYLYVLDGERRRPDPVSRAQPSGVHGPSRVIDPARFSWTDAGWSTSPLNEQILYELHVGTFTREGTFDAIIPRIAHLKNLGVTAIELMPVAAFPGARNWGYDGVHLFAPQWTYGGPDGLRRLVDAAHREGVAVIMDVVYNHFGPEGNYLLEYAPFFNDHYKTPWGDAINVDGRQSDGVRRHLITNALYWLREFHVDGLRLDAIHGIFDFSARHLLEELKTEWDREAARMSKQAFIIAESDLNDPRVLAPKERGGHALDAQWSDDFHHAVRTALTGDRKGYFEDFGAVEDIDKAFVDGYVYAGRYSKHRERRHGAPLGDRPGSELVVYLQTHDQVANASSGQRITALLERDQQRLAAALLMFAPNVPMLFMGEEYGETAPFHYFIDHGDDGLVRAVVEGRRREHESFHTELAFADPSAESTYAESTLDWSLRDQATHAQHLALYRDLIALRRSTSALTDGRRDLVRARSDERDRWLVIERGGDGADTLLLVCNLGREEHAVPIELAPGTWELALTTDAKPYGGAGFEVARELVGGRASSVRCAGGTAQIYRRPSR